MMLDGKLRITITDELDRPQVADVKTGDQWDIPPGLPHSQQSVASTRAEFLLAFDNGKASEFNTLLLTDWVAARMTVFDTGPKANDRGLSRRRYRLRQEEPRALRGEHGQHRPGVPATLQVRPLRGSLAIGL